MKDRNLDILFVIVLYKTTLEKSCTYQSILKSLDTTRYNLDLVVYNNSPDYFVSANNVPNISITYIDDKINGGVSKAYNTGAKIAARLNKKWLLLLDQDSNFPLDTISKYVAAKSDYPGIKLFVPLLITSSNKVISPCHVIFKRGFFTKNKSTGLRLLNNYSPINCGICIELSAFNIVGGYDENIKLDFSDFDFIERYKKNISNNFVVINLIIKHELSTTMVNTFKSDFNRFAYYLEGGKYYSKTKYDRFFININAFLRACKLSVIHKNFSFILYLLE